MTRDEKTREEAKRLRTSDNLTAAVKVRCPYCGARAGEACEDFRGGFSHKTHLKRIRAALTPTPKPGETT